jgi:3-hydroxyacyl-CoA dehydrogenase
MNRLQFALVREALHLLKTGVADVEAIDKVVSDGLGLRWALLGPFGVADTNHDEGVRGYIGGHEDWITNLMDQLGPTPTLENELTERIGAALDRTRGAVSRADVRAWRDRMVLAIRELKASHPLPTTPTKEQRS